MLMFKTDVEEICRRHLMNGETKEQVEIIKAHGILQPSHLLVRVWIVMVF